MCVSKRSPYSPPFEVYQISRRAKREPSCCRAASPIGAASARASIFDTARGKRGGAWVVRRYLGDQDYKVETIATADDVEDANGVDVLDFWASSRGWMLSCSP